MDFINAYNVVKYGAKEAGKKLVKWGKETPRVALGALLLFTGLNAFFSFYQPADPPTSSINFLYKGFIFFLLTIFSQDIIIPSSVPNDIFLLC